ASATASASVVAQPSSSAPTPRPPVVGEPKTNLQALALSAVSRSEFEKLVEGNEWAVYDPGTTDCPAGGETVHLDRPEDLAREFDRQKVRSELVDKLVFTSEDVGTVKPDDESSGALSAYNHAAGTFNVKLHAVGMDQ